MGQSEVEVAGLADTTVVLVAPGAGDAVQAAKAGVLEIGDIYVVNKADRDGAAQVRRELRSVLASTPRPDGAWRPPVASTVATSGEGIDELVELVARHRDHLTRSGELDDRRRRRAGAEIEAIAVATLRRRWEASPGEQGVSALAAAVAEGRLDPWTAAARLIS